MRYRVLVGIHTAVLAVVLHTWPVRIVRDTPAVTVVSAPVTSASVSRSVMATGTLTRRQLATVVRIPNRALWFRPEPGLLQAIGEAKVPCFPAPESAGAPLSQVWTYNGTEFTAVGVRTGAVDGDWTEIVAGAIRPGDRLVTSASLSDQ